MFALWWCACGRVGAGAPPPRRRLMRHHEDLDILALLPQQARNGCRSGSSHTGVDLIMKTVLSASVRSNEQSSASRMATFFTA